MVGPKGFTSPVREGRPSRRRRVLGRDAVRPQGREVYWSKGVYREIVPPERAGGDGLLRRTSTGTSCPASYYGMSGDWPQETLVTVTFEEQGGQTKLSCQAIPRLEGR